MGTRLKIGYARVSTDQQVLDLQVDALNGAGCDRVYEEKQSGKSVGNRPVLKEVMRTLRKGDTLVVWKLDRLGRSTKELIEIVEELKAKGIGFESISDKIDTASAQGMLFFTIFAALAEFERNVISERTKEGLRAARARGRVGGRRPKLSVEERRRLVKLYDAKTMSVADIARQFDVSRNTVYRVIREKKGENWNVSE